MPPASAQLPFSPEIPQDLLQAASGVTRHIPRDQALGLRLIALARAASAIHLAQAASPQRTSCANDHLRSSQAQGLLRLIAEGQP